MRRSRFGGRGRNNSSRGSRGGRGFRGGRGGGFRGSDRGGRGRGGERQASNGGNSRERIAVESGHLVFIDQFMLANPQFIEKLAELLDAEPESKDVVVRDYGGCVVEVQPGTYRIDRDPYAMSIVIHPEGQSISHDQLSRDRAVAQGHVFVDTRCLAMVDRELLDDSQLLEKYQQLWFAGKDKACRDLLRDNGGAVRYGFQRSGDELGVYSLPDKDVLCLWPDVAEGVEMEVEEASQEAAE